MSFAQVILTEWERSEETSMLDRPHHHPLTWMHVLMMSGDVHAAAAAFRLAQSGTAYEYQTGEVNPEW